MARAIGLPLVALACIGCGTASGTGESDPAGTVEAPAVEPDPVEPGGAPTSLPYAPGIDVLHYQIDLDLRHGPDLLEGRARIRFLRTTENDDDRLPLDLTGLAVDSVRIGQARARRLETVPRTAYRDSLPAGRLPVPLPESAGAGDTLAVVVHYRGTPDDGMILGETVHGSPAAFADNWPNRARFWFPSVDHPSDKATASFLVRAPETWQVVANGSPLSPPTPIDDEEEGRTWRWETAAPIPTYTMVVGAAEFRVQEVGLAACQNAPLSPRRDGCVEVTTWLYPSDTARAAPSFERAAEMVDYFTRTIGPYPYEKLANVQAATRFGGMENASAVFYSERALAAGRDIEGTVAHEIAHQWFGDSVTESDWHHLWLSEGFATYFGALFFEAADGVDDFRERMEANRRGYVRSDVVDRPIVNEEEDDLFALLNANNYQKGAWVLHVLRGVLGDEAFFRGIREFYGRNAHGTALTDDLRSVMEEVSERELGWFFDQWVFEPGHPVISTAWTWDEAGQEAHLTIRQEQPDGWPTFRIPAEVAFVLDDGQEERRQVELTERVQEWTMELPAAPREVVFDPDGWVLKETDTEQ